MNVSRGRGPRVTALALILAAPFAGPPAQAAGPPGDDKAFDKVIRPFFKAHCVRCHGAVKKQGKFSLHTFGAEVADHQAGYAAVLERLRAGDMPPDGEPKPDAKAARQVAAWVGAGLAAKPSGEKAAEVAVKPGEGNRVPHALLFGTAPTKTTPPPPRLWRMRPSSYRDGFVLDLRPKGVQAKDLSQPFDLIPDPGVKDYADLYSIDGAGTEVLLRNAERLVEGQAGGVREFAPLFHPKVPPTPEQLEKAIRTQFRLALVRDPTADELRRLAALYEKNLKVADRPAAAKTMLMAPLVMPEAVYRFELGRGEEVRPGVRMLSPKEVAFALSLALSDRREAKLFAAADKGDLITRKQVADHARRLLDDPKFPKPRLLGFFREYFGYPGATEVFKDRPKDVIHRPEVLVADTDRLVLDILERDKKVLAELLTTRKSFVNYSVGKDKKTKKDTPKPAVVASPINDKGRKSPEAAYGFDRWPESQPVDLPGERLGVLMQPSWLVAWSGNFDNDPVRRGRWVRERLLGGQVPELPIGIDAKVPDEPHQTLRHRFRVTREAQCWKCHQKMDDLGLPFEGFDHYGKPRKAEPVLDPKATAKNVDKKGKPLGPVLRDAPLVTTGRVAASGDPKLDGPVADAATMLRRLADSERVRQMFIRHVFRYYMGRNETPGDALTLQEADRAYVKSGGSFKALLVSLLSSESFLYRATTR